MYACVCVSIYSCGKLTPIHEFLTECDPYLEIDLRSQAGVACEAGNAHHSGTPGYKPFARSTLLHWVFTGLISIFYSCCLFSDL